MLITEQKNMTFYKSSQGYKDPQNTYINYKKR